MLTLACRGVSRGGQGGVTPCQSLHTFFWEESMSPSRLERQTACSMHFNPKGQRPFVGKRLSTARKSHRRPGEGRGLPFLLREERGAKKRKRDRLGPFSNPHEVPVQEAVRNHRACKSPCGEFVRGGSVSLLQVNLLRGHQFAQRRLRPPLSSKLHVQCIFSEVCYAPLHPEMAGNCPSFCKNR